MIVYGIDFMSFSDTSNEDYSLQEVKDCIVRTNKPISQAFLWATKIWLQEKKDIQPLGVVEEKECLKFFSEHRYI